MKPDPLHPYVNENGKAFNGNWLSFLPLGSLIGFGLLAGLLWLLLWAASLMV